MTGRRPRAAEPSRARCDSIVSGRPCARYAADRGVRLIGDMPIYVARGGVDHRMQPGLFLEGLQAGVPPDAFTSSGQLWGNPLYDWPALRRTGYRWWVERLRRTFELFDVTRIDHFRGFVAAWAVPEGAADARAGHWRRGPGRALFAALRAELGDLPLIAEDLGLITPPVSRLRDELGLPGMAVLQFAFDPAEPDTPHWPAHQHEQQVVYTGTHDNDTLRGWWSGLPEQRRALAAEAVRAILGRRRGVAIHPPGPGVTRARVHRADPGRPGPRLRGADELPGS